MVMSIFHRGSIAIISLDIMDSLQLSLASAGFLSSSTMLAYGIMQLPSGLLADMYGGRKVVFFLTLIAGIAALVSALTYSYPIALGARFMLGIGIASFVPMVTLLAAHYPPQAYSRALSLLMGIGTLGNMLAATPLLFLSKAFDWRFALGFFALITLALACMFFWYTKGKSQKKHKETSYTDLINHAEQPELPELAKLANLAENPQNPAVKKEGFAPILLGIKRVLTSRQFWPLCIWQMACVAPMFMLTIFWLVPYLVQVNGIDSTMASYFLLAATLLSVALMPCSGYLSDVIAKARRWPVLVCTGIALLSAVPFVTHSGSIPFYALVLQLGGLFFSITFAAPLIYTMVKESFPPELTGTATGCLNMFYPIALFILQIPFGYIIEWRLEQGLGYGAAFRSAGWIILISYIIGFLATLYMEETFPGKQKKKR